MLFGHASGSDHQEVTQEVLLWGAARIISSRFSLSLSLSLSRAVCVSIFFDVPWKPCNPRHERVL
jgi:hypothetical protein